MWITSKRPSVSIFRFRFNHRKAATQRPAHNMMRKAAGVTPSPRSQARLRRQQTKGTSGSNLLSAQRLSHVWPQWVHFTFACTNLDPCAPHHGLGNCSEHLLPVPGQSIRVQQIFSCCRVPRDRRSPPTSTLVATGATAKN